MIQTRSELIVGDSSGAQLTRCIRVINKFRYRVGFAGDLIILTVLRYRKAIKRRRVVKDKLYLGLIILTRKKYCRKVGTQVSFAENKVVLLTKERTPIGKRLNSCIFFEVRKRGFLRIATMSKGVI